MRMDSYCVLLRDDERSEDSYIGRNDLCFFRKNLISDSNLIFRGLGFNFLKCEERKTFISSSKSHKKCEPILILKVDFNFYTSVSLVYYYEPSFFSNPSRKY